MRSLTAPHQCGPGSYPGDETVCSLHAATQPILASLRNAPLWGGAFRDDIKNDGCIADYTIFRSSLLLVLSLVPIEVFLFVIWLCPLHKNQRNTSKFQFDLERTESTRFNELLRTPKRSVGKQITNYSYYISNTHYIHY